MATQRGPSSQQHAIRPKEARNPGTERARMNPEDVVGPGPADPGPGVGSLLQTESGTVCPRDREGEPPASPPWPMKPSRAGRGLQSVRVLQGVEPAACVPCGEGALPWAPPPRGSVSNGDGAWILLFHNIKIRMLSLQNTINHI